MRDVLERDQLQKASSLQLSPSQLYLLKLMAKNGSHQVGEAAGYLGVSPPAATKTIDKLERLGLVTRTPSAGDRRATLLSVSRKGRRLVRKFEKLVLLPLVSALESFEPDEVEKLSELLERLAISLLEAERTEVQPSACLRCAAYLESNCPVGHVHDGCPYRKERGDHRGNRSKAPP